MVMLIMVCSMIGLILFIVWISLSEVDTSNNRGQSGSGGGSQPCGEPEACGNDERTSLQTSELEIGAVARYGSGREASLPPPELPKHERAKRRPLKKGEMRCRYCSEPFNEIIATTIDENWDRIICPWCGRLQEPTGLVQFILWAILLILLLVGIFLPGYSGLVMLILGAILLIAYLYGVYRRNRD
jgi:hypothetical protein